MQMKKSLHKINENNNQKKIRKPYRGVKGSPNLPPERKYLSLIPWAEKRLLASMGRYEEQ